MTTRNAAYTKANAWPPAAAASAVKTASNAMMAHLQEDDRARPTILAAVELEVRGPVDPGDPDQGEHDGELDEPGSTETSSAR